MVKSVSGADIRPKFYFIITLKFLGLCSPVARLDLWGGGGGVGESRAPKPQAARGVPPKVFEIQGL